MKRMLHLFFTGFAMGSADIVPGVSGGTIAFIFGIYKDLVNSIKHVSGETLALLLKGQVRQAIAGVPFAFLVPLVLGIGAAVITLANLLSRLLEDHPVYVWSFFFGLVLASVLVVRKRVTHWTPPKIALLLAAALGAYVLVGAVPVETPETALAFFLSGSIAIVAMILPGVSGSFILVLLGKYEQVLAAVTDRDILTLLLIIAGAAIGLALFSRILSWLFAKHHDLAIAVLTGFMLGSLRKIWPWKEVMSTRINRHGDEVPLHEVNILPPAWDETVLLAVFLAGLAIALILYLESLQATREQQPTGPERLDVPDSL